MSNQEEKPELKIVSCQVSKTAWHAMDSLTMIKSVSISKVLGLVIESWLVQHGIMAPGDRHTEQAVYDEVVEAAKVVRKNMTKAPKR